MVSFFSGEDSPSTDTSHFISLLPEVCRSVLFGPPCIDVWDALLLLFFFGGGQIFCSNPESVPDKHKKKGRGDKLFTKFHNALKLNAHVCQKFNEILGLQYGIEDKNAYFFVCFKWNPNVSNFSAWTQSFSYDDINRTLGYQVNICHFVQLFILFRAVSRFKKYKRTL